jgi:hypothetical protein
LKICDISKTDHLVCSYLLRAMWEASSKNTRAVIYGYDDRLLTSENLTITLIISQTTAE